jgi:hypothetical protein
MCLALIAFAAHPRYRLIIAANRDEFHARPAAPAAWWAEGFSPAAISRPAERGSASTGVGAWRFSPTCAIHPGTIPVRRRAARSCRAFSRRTPPVGIVTGARP